METSGVLVTFYFSNKILVRQVILLCENPLRCQFVDFSLFGMLYLNTLLKEEKLCS